MRRPTTDIIYETDSHYVFPVPNIEGAYEVYRKGVTYSTRCSLIKGSTEEAWALAIKECNDRSRVHDAMSGKWFREDNASPTEGE